MYRNNIVEIMTEITTFEEAEKFISKPNVKPDKSVPNDRKLKLYALYKQVGYLTFPLYCTNIVAT